MTALEAPRRNPEQQRPRRWGLAQVPIPQRRMAGVPFILTLGVFLALGMVGLLLLNTSLQDQSFTVQAKQKEANLLGYRVAALESEVTEARSSTRLAIEATKLGMIPNPYPVYLSLPAGQVVGDPTRLSGSELPDVRYRTPEQLAALTAQKAAAEKQRVADLKAKKAAAEKKKKEEAAAKKAAEEQQKKEAAAKKKAEAEKKAAAAKKKAADEKKKRTDR